MLCEAVEYQLPDGLGPLRRCEYNDDFSSTVKPCPGKRSTPNRTVNRSESPRYVSLVSTDQAGRYTITLDVNENDKSKPPQLEEVDLEELLRKRLNTILECEEDEEDEERPTEDVGKPYRFTTPSLLLAKSLALYLAFMAMGFCSAVVGPTMVNLESMYKTDAHTFSLALTGIGLGYLVGGFIAGRIFDGINKEIQFAIAAAVGSLATALAPFGGSLFVYISVMALQSVGLGFMDTGGNAYGLYLWLNLRWKDSLLQGLYVAWSLGSTLAPIIVTPYLAPVDISTLTNSSHNGLTQFKNYTTLSEIEGNNVTDLIRQSDVAFVRYAYVVIASIMALCALIFLALLLIQRPARILLGHRQSQSEKLVQPETLTAVIIGRRKVLLVALFFYCFFYLGMECCAGSFVASFVVKHLSWTPEEAATLTAAFWGCLGLGRLANVFLSACFPPRIILTINTCITILAFSLMQLINHNPTHIIWMSVALAGVGLSSTFATTVLWASRHISVTASVASVFIVGGSLAAMLFPPLMGFLFDTYTPMWFVYILLIVAFVHGLLFLFLSMISEEIGTCRDRHYSEST